MYKSINACRICGNENLKKVLNLGNQALTGVFPRSEEKSITSGPLTLLKCVGQECCGLLQLEHSYSLEEMYGENYGYRSGLNPTMVSHLKEKVKRIEALGVIEEGDLIVDIGSNDATTLKQYSNSKCTLVGIDPTAKKFRKYYTKGINLIEEFFSAGKYKGIYGARKAKVITSFSMFYDLEDPTNFMREIAEILADNGVWVFEQSYMPSMLSTNSYDTVCHEHLEYYALKQIMWMAERAGLKVIDVEQNDVNGGSFSITAQKKAGRLKIRNSVTQMVKAEAQQNLDFLQTYVEFSERTEKSKNELLSFLHEAKEQGKRVVALGASTKGNVILQYCGIDSSLISEIGEVNQEKFGSFTPGTHIPILSEEEVIAKKPDYAIVLPWHFRKYFDAQDRYRDITLVYPLPELSLGK